MPLSPVNALPEAGMFTDLSSPQPGQRFRDIDLNRDDSGISTSATRSRHHLSTKVERSSSSHLLFTSIDFLFSKFNLIPNTFTMSAASAACLFCRIVKGEIPSFKLYESERVLAFLDIMPLSRGHALVIPKFHGVKLTDIPDQDLAELLPVAKKLAIASGAVDFNILQNNGRPAHQFVDHM
ncbi:bis(5'-nucleosidyl)-tetraphosphatase [Blastomyces dermatitidis ATCC 18188]|uniref:Bis(5'-nucleosidyl)-tetraphosphatase n=1 Tax=Ajellomyces dermatitidis (strain ATCC 18188 / CBS 674.68) TaxID=653446 RepID=F2T4V0_AJEDA|nr:bis(5'-nucleosidyl)-tetraphosphatase [Blastomyces dermatitidis ATCC 18188]